MSHLPNVSSGRSRSDGFSFRAARHCDVDWNSFFSRFVVRSTTSVDSEKHWQAAWGVFF